MNVGLRFVRPLQIFSVVACLFAVVLLKCQRLAIYPSLWGEDTKVYINDALGLGWRSVITPANGYQTLYSRLVAVPLSVLPLQSAEILFHIGSAFALAFTFLVLWRCLPIDSAIGRFTACVALVWVPADTLEIYFALVNTNWPLGVALTVLVTSQAVTEGRFRHAWLPAMLVLTLSGPMSIILLPVVAVRAAVFRDLRGSLPFYLVYGLGSGLQLYTTLMNSLPRLGAQTDGSAADWYEGLVNRILLGFFSGPWLLVLTAALLAWFLRKEARRLSARTMFQIAALPVVGGLALAAGLYAVRDIPALVGPYALHVRYFVIPFALALLFILAIGRNRLRYPSIATVLLICGFGFRPYYHDDFGSPQDQMAGGASRAPTYLGLYLKASHYVSPMKFFGRPGQEAFTLVLPETTVEQAPVSLSIASDDVENGGFEMPEACSHMKTMALALDYKAGVNAIIQFNTANHSAWYAQYHALEPGSGKTVFAAPISNTPAVEVAAANIEFRDARLVCF